MKLREGKIIGWLLVILAVVWVIKASGDEYKFDPGTNGSLITNWDVKLAFERYDTHTYAETDTGVGQAMTDGMILMYVSGLMDARAQAAFAYCGPHYAAILVGNWDAIQLAHLTATVMIEDKRGNEAFKFSALPWFFEFSCKE